MKPQKTLLKNSFLFLLFIIILHTTSFSQTEDSLYYLNPEYKIAKELFNHRIVMLGDCGHHSPIVTDNFLNVLKQWSQLTGDTREDTVKLSIILEIDSIHACLINDFMSSGNIKPVIDYLVPGGFLEELEFCKRLKDFYCGVKNTSLNKKDISLEVCGFEASTYNNPDKEHFLKSKRDSELWFINERDSLLSERITNYINKNPQNHVLIFYGSGHLVNGFVSKNFGFDDLSPDECMGYYLVYYLKKNFGDSNVLSVYQEIIRPDYSNDVRFEKVKDKEILVNSRNANLPEANFGDMYVYKDWKYIPLICNELVFSRYIIEKTIRYLKSIEAYTEGFRGQRAYKRYFDDLYIITGKRFSGLEEVKD